MNPTLTQIAADQRERSFVNPMRHSLEEGLGIALAHHFEWDGLKILQTFYSALEDANFHTEAEKVADMIAEVERDG